MKKKLFLQLLFLLPLFLKAELIHTVPGPGDQGGMIMPMISIINADDPNNPTSGEIMIDFEPDSAPLLRSLQEYSPGTWFSKEAAWRNDLGSPAGIGDTPAENAGNGSLFNNQIGFMFMAMPMMRSANIPAGKSLAIRLIETSSTELRAFNYLSSQNLWDPIFEQPGAQLLWNGAMWHNYFTLPADTPAGFYEASFEIFIADTPFTSGTGAADYSENARNAKQDTNFTPATLTCFFRVAHPDGITFPQWLTQNFTPEELNNPEKTSPNADPGSHNIPNLIRYAFNLDPHKPDPAQMPQAILQSTENRSPGIRFNRRKNALDLRLRIEKSDDLISWQTFSGTTETSDIDSETETVTAIDLSSPESGSRFYRISAKLHNTE